MELSFVRGNQDSAKGHALLYFSNVSDSDDFWATYLVILPIKVDITKYVPPFLMNQVGDLSPKDFSAFAFPPAPEQVGSYKLLEDLASHRDDDIVFGGTFDPSDVTTSMMSVNETMESYADVYLKSVPQQEIEPIPTENSSSLGVNEVLYGLMGDADKLSELTKLAGQLRFALEGSDGKMIQEVESDLSGLANFMPDNHKIHRLVETIKSEGNANVKLAELYLKRCFHLVQEEYIKLGELESEIRSLESGSEGIPK